MAKKKWIQSATENSHGQFAAKAQAAGMSTREFAEKHKDAKGVLGKQARLALTLMGMHHHATAGGHEAMAKAMYGGK